MYVSEFSSVFTQNETLQPSLLLYFLIGDSLKVLDLL